MTDTAYAIGVDFGTESGRTVLLDLSSGEERSSAVVPYPNGVIDRTLPGGDERLRPDWALQDPDDWILVLEDGLAYLVEDAGIDPSLVVGVGIDFTSCTVLPVDSEGVPLCKYPHWRRRPHAWPKLWKHHAAQPVADRLNEVAIERGEPWLGRYGGRISSEWYFPKLIELWLEDRELYNEAHSFVEATDWIVWWLTGRLTRQSCTAGYKAMYSPDDGLPSREYFEAAYPGFDTPGEKLGRTFVPLGTRAGTLRPEAAQAVGLPETVAVAVGNVDSFVSLPGCGVDRPRSYVTVVGTSICDMLVHPDEVRLPGITGVVKDGILPGLYGYEAGQVAVGDMLAWYVDLLGGAGGGFAELEQAAARLGPGETGLVALDWWNGNRSILADADLTGVILGLTLQTEPGQLYRALLESIAFGNRRIVENFAEHGLAVDEVIACGGIAERSPLLMQMFADTSGLPVHVPASSEIPARGSALFGAVAAGTFEDIGAAINATRPPVASSYLPDADSKTIYDQVYAIYRSAYDLLGSSHAELLHGLKRIRNERSRA
ncbi:MAG TPA: ribulokinase [Solirubrobacteraceae bacterium]